MQADVIKVGDAASLLLDVAVSVGVAVGSVAVDEGAGLGGDAGGGIGHGGGDAGEGDLLGGSGLGLGDLVDVGRVRVVKGAEVSGDGPRAVDGGVLGREIGLVKVPSVGNVSTVNGWKVERSHVQRHITSALTLNDQRRVGADQQGASAHTPDGSGAALLVNGDITAHDNRVSSVPRLALDPVDAVEERGGGAVTGVLVVDTFNVVVAVLGEEVHEQGLGGLGLVDQGLGSDIESTDREGVDVVLFKQRGDDCGVERE